MDLNLFFLPHSNPGQMASSYDPFSLSVPQMTTNTSLPWLSLFNKIVCGDCQAQEQTGVRATPGEVLCSWSVRVTTLQKSSWDT